MAVSKSLKLHQLFKNRQREFRTSKMSIAETVLPLFLPVRTLNCMSRSVPVYFRFAFGLRFSSKKKTVASRSVKVKREVFLVIYQDFQI